MHCRGLVQRQPLLRLHPLLAGARDAVRRAVGRLLRPAGRLGRLADRVHRRRRLGVIPPRHCADLAAKGGVRRRPPPLLLGRAVRALPAALGVVLPGGRHRLAPRLLLRAVPAAHTVLDGRRLRRHRRRLRRRALLHQAITAARPEDPPPRARRGRAAGGRRAGRRVDEGRRRRGRRAGPSARSRGWSAGSGGDSGTEGLAPAPNSPALEATAGSSSAEGSPRLGPSALPRDGSRKLFTQALEDSYRSSVAAKRSEGSSPERMV